MFAVEIVLSSHFIDTTSLEAAILDFPFPVKSGSIPISAIGIAVVENGRGAAVGIVVLSHREAEISLRK